MRLIDADELNIYDVSPAYGFVVMGMTEEDINDAPTVDAVELVRCKDCENWEKTWTNDWGKDYHYCPMVDGVRKADFYCADAERRSE